MNTELKKMPTPPADARFLQIGERIEVGDLMWEKDYHDWAPVRCVVGDTTIRTEQQGFYCRKT